METVGKNVPNTPMLGALVKATGVLEFEPMMKASLGHRCGLTSETNVSQFGWWPMVWYQTALGPPLAPPRWSRFGA